MNKAAEILKSHTDFQCFSKSRTSTEHFLCDIFHAKWQEDGTNLIFYVKANRFLRGMVRAIVGTMLEIGMEELSLQDFEKIIISKDRKKAGRSVPPQGLFLTHVEYPVNLIKKIA